jgi:WS/DGAT/MGAT family acyltransferase
MPDPRYQRLSPQDATFLDLESASQHMHIAATIVFRSGPLRTASGGVDIERIRAYIGARLHLLPRYRQRLARIPIGKHPVWVDDPHFNIGYHVRHAGIPRPGELRQLKRLSGRILSQQLDRQRPLWELWVVEGLGGGEHFAMVQKVHHCMIDGISAVDLMAVLMTPTPEDDFEPGPPWEPQEIPRGLELIGAEITRRLGATFDATGEAPRGLREPRSLLGKLEEKISAVGAALGAGLRSASDTPLNQPIGPHRRFDWIEMDLDAVKAVKNRLGGTVNDVVLATVAGAVRRFLELRRVVVDDLAIRANVPVSLRTQDERGTLGNRIALLMMDLPVDEKDPLARLECVRENMGRLKQSKQAMGAEVLSAVSEWTSATLLSLAVRVSVRGRPYNLVVTNVPGPQVPLYMLGAEMEACYPVVNLLPNQGLGVALFSYAGKLFWGFVADWDVVPDLHEFVLAIEESFAQLAMTAPRESKDRAAARGSQPGLNPQ